MPDSKGDVTVSLSMERIIAYALMMIAIGSFYAKIQGDLNYLRERSDKLEVRFDRIETRLYQLDLYESRTHGGAPGAQAGRPTTP